MAAVSLLWAWFYRMRRGNQVTAVSALANVALVAEAGLALALRTHPERRAGALRDGVLIDVSAAAREAGIRYPVALTRAAWERCVTVPPGVACQAEAGRLWDVLWRAIR
jgi:hypothetical protein